LEKDYEPGVNVAKLFSPCQVSEQESWRSVCPTKVRS